MATTATRRILAEEGFTYDCYAFNDDIPYFAQVAERRLLVVPYTLDNNDIRFVKNQLFVADQFFHYLRDTFDILYEESEQSGKLMSVGLHPRVIGRQGRALGLDRFLSHVRQFPDVWVANRNEIARFWLEQYG